MSIPFNKPYLTGKELEYMQLAMESHRLSGNNAYTEKCESMLEKKIGCHKALLTPSCTAALEMAALLIDIKAGDEIIMPSFTFVSTANAFVLRGAKPVFIDIREDTLNIDENKLLEAITDKTKAIVVVHYAGVSCDMDKVMEIANEHNLFVIEDAAQCINSNYKNRPLGSIGHLGTLSFHETKNIHCGEGGALLINDPTFIDRAEVIREKGTNRQLFFKGKVDKYTWVEPGSSYLLSDVSAAFLLAQLENADFITQQRLKCWNYYHDAFLSLEQDGLLQRPIIPEECTHNGHIYYLLLPTMEKRDNLIKNLSSKQVNCVFHYIPLHSSPAGKQYTKVSGELIQTESLSGRLVRLPMWVGLEKDIDKVTGALADCI